MAQQEIREYNNEQYSVTEGAAMIAELKYRTDCTDEQRDTINKIAAIISRIKFKDGNNPNDAVFTNGKVGIGTLNPQAILDVINPDADDLFRLGRTISGDALKIDEYGQITTNVIGSVLNMLRMSRNGTELLNYNWSGGFKNRISSAYSTGLYINNDVNKAIILKNNGNVGIGTFYPYAANTYGAKLHVQSPTASGSHNTAKFAGGNGAANSNSVVRITTIDTGMYLKGGIPNGGDQNMGFGEFGVTDANGTQTKALTIDNNRNIILNGNLVPVNVTEAERLAISLPKISSIVYQTDGTEGIYIYKSTGWTLIS
jgi:hypothetical protein